MKTTEQVLADFKRAASLRGTASPLDTIPFPAARTA